MFLKSASVRAKNVSSIDVRQFLRIKGCKVLGPAKTHNNQNLGDATFFAYNWKLPAYSGAFFLTVDKFSFFTYSWSFFAYNFSFFTYNWSFFAYSRKVRLIRALRDCKQWSLTVSKKAPTVSKKASSESDRLSAMLSALNLGNASKILARFPSCGGSQKGGF